MKTSKHFLFVSLLLLTVARVEAQSIEIYPVPHNVNWSQNVAFDNSATYTIVGEADADVDAVALFKKKFTLNGNVELVIGERDCSVVCSGFSDDCSISVMDICGNVVGRGRGNAVISMQGESKGLYIVMVEEVSGKKVYKILHY